MQNNVTDWLKVVLKFEGGKVDDPKDPGGRTAYGVTQRVYNGWRKAGGLKPRDVWLIETKEIVAIYKLQYWDKVWGDQLPDGVDYVVADGAVNSGPVQSVKWLQRALAPYYKGRVDGLMGPSTLAAIKEWGTDYDALIARILDLRMAFLRALKTFPRFGKGWTSRVNQLRAIGQAVATGSVGPVPVKVADMGRKALVEDGRKGPPKLDAIWGAGASGGVLSQAIGALSPVQELAFIGKLVTFLTIAGVVLTVLGLLYREWARNRQHEIAKALDLKPVLEPDHAANDDLPEGLDDVAA